MDSGHRPDAADRLAPAALEQYRRDGYLVVRGLLAPDHVAACIDALAALAADETVPTTSIPGEAPFITFEPGVAAFDADAAAAIDRIRKFGNFTDRSPALLRAAMSAQLHAILDQLMGGGRVLIQEMALVKPPRIGGEKRWHQDAAYFRADDPDLVFGVWIALDPVDAENGCMQVIPGSQRAGPVPHIPDSDINLCTIRPDHVRLAARLELPMDPGDVLIFHSLMHHYTAPNRSGRRRRALQFHYHQRGVRWTSLAEHRALYHDEAGGYAGCTVPAGAPQDDSFSYRPRRLRPVVPIA
jgi:phytanoyl-CoA hydroxylase